MSLRGHTHLIRSMQTQLLLFCHRGILLILRDIKKKKFKAPMSAHFPAGLTGTTPNVLCPLPNLRKGRKKKEAHMKPIFTICHQEHRGKNMSRREIDFICFSISSHSLSGTCCHLLFGERARIEMQRRMRPTVRQTCKNSVTKPH